MQSLVLLRGAICEKTTSKKSQSYYWAFRFLINRKIQQYCVQRYVSGMLPNVVMVRETFSEHFFCPRCISGEIFFCAELIDR